MVGVVTIRVVQYIFPDPKTQGLYAIQSFVGIAYLFPMVMMVGLLMAELSRFKVIKIMS